MHGMKVRITHKCWGDGFHLLAVCDDGNKFNFSSVGSSHRMWVPMVTKVLLSVMLILLQHRDK